MHQRVLSYPFGIIANPETNTKALQKESRNLHYVAVNLFGLDVLDLDIDLFRILLRKKFEHSTATVRTVAFG